MCAVFVAYPTRGSSHNTGLNEILTWFAILNVYYTVNIGSSQVTYVCRSTLPNITFMRPHF